MAMIEATQEGMPTREGDLSIESHGMEPIPESARYGSVGRIFTVWFTPNLVPAAFFIGTLVTLDFLKLGFVTAILADRGGQPGRGRSSSALLSTMGPKLGLAQMPAARLPFGKTIAVPGLLNWFSTIGWDGINSVFGAVALTLLIPGAAVHRRPARDRALPGGARASLAMRRSTPSRSGARSSWAPCSWCSPS